MQSHHAEDEDQRQNQYDDWVDLQAGRLVGVEPYSRKETISKKLALDICRLLEPKQNLRGEAVTYSAWC